ncbi:MAG: NosD domain-containing protein [Phycisphaerales bacterium]
MYNAFSALLVVFTLSSFSNADTLLVPSEYGSIQAGIDAANDGDIVSVESGVYYERIDFKGKQITVSSVSGLPMNTTIDGGNSGTVVTFELGETSASVIEGFTIKDGKAFTGGGVRVMNASPVIKNCIIKNNQSDNSGAGIFVDTGSVTIENTILRGNIAGDAGGGVYLKFCQGSITGCDFEENFAKNGAGMYVKDSTAELMLVENAFVGNTATNDGGAIFNKATSAIVQDCSFTGNSANKGGAWFSYSGGDAILSYSIFADNNSMLSGGAAEIRGSEVTFTLCTFDSNLADSDCDGSGGSGVVEIVNSTVILNNPTICTNLVCDAQGDFSGEQPTIIGDILECVIGIGACCGGSACWQMEEEVCLNGGGEWAGDTTLCATTACEGGTTSCAADLNGDGAVEVLDIIMLIQSWGACP